MLLLRFHLLPCHARSLPRFPTWSKKICELALPRLVRAAWVGLIGSPCGLGRDVPWIYPYSASLASMSS